MEPRSLTVGDVVQLSPETDDKLFAGCLMLVTEPKSWGAQGYVSIPRGRDQMPGRAYYRCKFVDMEYVGRAGWVPADDAPGEND